MNLKQFLTNNTVSSVVFLLSKDAGFITLLKNYRQEYSSGFMWIQFPKSVK